MAPGRAGERARFKWMWEHEGELADPGDYLYLGTDAFKVPSHGYLWVCVGSDHVLAQGRGIRRVPGGCRPLNSQRPPLGRTRRSHGHGHGHGTRAVTNFFPIIPSLASFE